MDEKDRLLLTYLHQGIPLVSQPFGALATRAGLDRAEVLVRIQHLKQEGVLGEIKAIWNPRNFYYQSIWVAMKSSPERLTDLTEIIHQHPGVIYSCEREHELNFWFFIAAPGEHDLGMHVRCLEKMAAPRKTFLLPVRKVLKGIDLLSALDAGTFPEMSEYFEKRNAEHASDLTAHEIELIRMLQNDFPMTDEPFRKVAASMKISEEEALEIAKSLTRKGCLRRIGSLIRKPVSGAQGHNLVVWHVPEEKLERIGEVIAEFSEILYADQRPAYPGFPYSLYTVIQAKNSAALEVVIRRLEDRIGKWPWDVLATKKELKKNRLKYFPKELDVWWEQSRHIAETAFH